MNLRLSPRGDRQSGQEMLPVINLVFLMLVFFSLMGAIATDSGVAAQLARARSGAATAAPLAGLALDAAGAAWLDGRALADQEIGDALRDWRAQHPAAPLSVHAPATVRGQRLVEVLALLRTAGIDTVELQVRAAQAP